MPGREIGLKWFGIDKKTRTLQVALSPPPLVRPGTTLKIPVKLGGLNPGEDAKIVLAAVDVGILNLTNYKPPAPDDYYLGQRRLTSEVRDLYGQLIDGMQGPGARCGRWGHRQSRRRHHGPEWSGAGAALCARRQGGDADFGAAFDPHSG